MKRTTLSVLTAVGLIVALTGAAQAATLTWTGGGDGHSWNQASNWGGTAPAFFDTLHITTGATIDNVYRTTGTATYDAGSTWRGIVNLNQGTVNMTAHFGSGSNGVFNIGDGIGAADATVNVSNAGWRFDRHGDGTFTVNIKQDGLLSGRYLNYGTHNNRKYVINVDGGRMTSALAWNMSDGPGNDANRVNLSSGGTVDVGAITVHEEVIHFQDSSGSSFTADYGSSFANIAAVNAALGTRFTAGGGNVLGATDNGTSFTVKVLPRTHEIGGGGTIGIKTLTGTQSNEVTTPGVDGAKYIRVDQNRGDQLNIAEVQAFETGTGNNVALASVGSVATQSSTGYGGVASRAIDGSTNGNYGSGSVQHTNNGGYKWWQVELASAADLDSVHFWGRTDCCQNRQDDFNLVVEDASHNELYNVRHTGVGTSPNRNRLIPLSSLGSADLTAMLTDIDTYVFELGSNDQLTIDEMGQPGVFNTILNVNNATIEVKLLGALTPGQVYTLFDVDSITGTYDNLILPAGVDGSMLLVDGTVTTALIPEPITMVALGMGITGLGGYVRKRTRA